MDRKTALLSWIQNSLQDNDCYIKSASEDASFRSYWRVFSKGKKFIAMDAPPELEDCKPFLRIAKQLKSIGINSPEIYDENIDQGFLLLSDLGSTHYLDVLNQENYLKLYSDAINAIQISQLKYNSDSLPEYNQQLLQSEINLFKDWFLIQHLDYQLTESQNDIFESVSKALIENAINQPQKFVHRDFHSRNLMISKDQNPAVIDFQDAVKGPVTYDLVSLLRDCYISWSDEQIQPLLESFLENYNINHEQEIDFKTFEKWFDLMGFQRHMKAIGIFCRLNYRDNKPGYLKDIPLTLSYLYNITEKYQELSDFMPILENACPSLINLCKQ